MEDLQREASKLIKETYVQQGLQSLKTRQNILVSLLNQGKLPREGLSDHVIEDIVRELSAMDSNNFLGNTGVGEREGRVYSSLVARRHFGLAHGIGRSGDIAEQQPKAAGSSIIYKVSNKLVAHAFELAGYRGLDHCLLMPLATGMTVTMTLLALRSKRPEAKYVIWPRIDQKSCFKAILTAGLTPIIVDNLLLENGELRTNLAEIASLIQTHGSDVLCVLATTSCFAPRQPDSVDEIAKLCKEAEIAHVINNAYGIQCATIAKSINRAIVVGRVDAVIQSTDKNFLVPVGGAIVASPSETVIHAVSTLYPGRAAMTPILDMFITLLSMGVNGFTELLRERIRLREVLLSKLHAFTEKHSGHIIPTPRNTISIAVTNPLFDLDVNQSNYFGSMLFQRNVSGCRMVSISNNISKISGFEFKNWGSHHADFPKSYVTVACAIGLRESEIDIFMERLDKVFQKFIKKIRQVNKVSSMSSSFSSDMNSNQNEQEIQDEMASVNTIDIPSENSNE